MTEPSLHRTGSLEETLLAVRREVSPDQRFLRYMGPDGRERHLRRGELWDRACRVAGLLLARGLRPGERVLIVSGDDGAVLTGVLACLAYGWSAVVLPRDSAVPEVRSAIALTGPRAALVDGHLDVPWMTEAVPNLLRVPAPDAGRGRLLTKLLGGDRGGTGSPGLWEELGAVELAPPPEALPPRSEAYVLLTSGSTARPKGVPITRAGLFLHARTLARQYGYAPGCRLLCTLPLHHTDGLMHGLLVPWLAGAQALRPVGSALTEAAALLDAVYALRATHFITVPTQLHLLERLSEGREDAFRSGEFRFVLSSAAPLEEALWRRFQDRFGTRVANLYGLTETVCGGLFCGPGDETFRMGTVGKPVDCEVRVVDEAGEAVAPGTTGELLMAGPHLTPGYLQAPGEAAEPPFVDGWFRTGDRACCDADGFYRIVGRKKNLVISGGLNIQPEEVGEVLSALPGVAEAVAFGLPDEAFGEILVACVVAEEGAEPAEAALREACAASLAPHKVPRRIVFVPALPRGTTGKVDTARARALFEAGRDRPVSGRSADSDAEVLTLAARVFGVPREGLSPRSGPKEIPRWDSFGHLTFAAELESRFALSLSTADILSLKTLADAQRLVRRPAPR